MKLSVDERMHLSICRSAVRLVASIICCVLLGNSIVQAWPKPKVNFSLPDNPKARSVDVVTTPRKSPDFPGSPKIGRVVGDSKQFLDGAKVGRDPLVGPVPAANYQPPSARSFANANRLLAEGRGRVLSFDHVGANGRLSSSKVSPLKKPAVGPLALPDPVGTPRQQAALTARDQIGRVPNSPIPVSPVRNAISSGGGSGRGPHGLTSIFNRAASGLDVNGEKLRRANVVNLPGQVKQHLETAIYRNRLNSEIAFNQSRTFRARVANNGLTSSFKRMSNRRGVGNSVSTSLSLKIDKPNRVVVRSRGKAKQRVSRKGFQDHHIISDLNKHTKDHELLKMAGFNLQSRKNKMFLPTNGSLHPTRSPHRGKHRESVSKTLAAGMDDIVTLGERYKWTKSQYNDALRSLIAKERLKLRSGHRALNRHSRSWADRY